MTKKIYKAKFWSVFISIQLISFTLYERAALDHLI